MGNEISQAIKWLFYEDAEQDNLTEDRIRDLLSIESDLKAYIADNPPEAGIKTLLSEASKLQSKESMKIIVPFIVQQFKERFRKKNVRIWAGEQVIDPGNVQTVLVCFYSWSLRKSMKTFYGLKVIYRDYNIINDESVVARAQERNLKIDLTPEQCDLINEAITIYGKSLFEKHSNLEAISSSVILSSKSRGLVHEPCVILYCRVKGITPFGEMPFPKSLNVNENGSIAVDVREGYFSSHSDNVNHLDMSVHESQSQSGHLRMGSSVGRAGSPQSGTIGPFVQINSHKIGFLTCAHVVFTEGEMIDLANGTQTDLFVKTIVQPPDNASFASQDSRKCGTLVYGMVRDARSLSAAEAFGIDAAVIEITSRFPFAGLFVPMKESQLDDAGFSLEHPPKFDTGAMMEHPIKQRIQSAVIKIGSETGLTRGLLRLTKGMVKYSAQSRTLSKDNVSREITLHGLMEISSANFAKNQFCTNGDSGAGVFLVDDADLTCVGILVGNLTDAIGYAMPIDKILTALSDGYGRKIKLKEFSSSDILTHFF